MSKFKTGLVKEYEEKKAVAQEQQSLRAKHNIKTSDVLIVEKSNMAKFTVKTLGSIIRVVASIFVSALAIVGVVSMIYPVPRAALLEIWNMTLSTVLNLFQV